MMYANKIAVAIKVDGRVLRESKSKGSDKDDTVFIPFGSHYSLYVKNMNSVRALVKFEIDGTDATEGVQIIVPANGHIELERFIKKGNRKEGLKFKFIERTQKIEDGPRGIKVEDGLIRVEYEFEREPAKIVPSPYTITTTHPWSAAVIHHYHNHHYDTLSPGNYYDTLARGISTSDVSYSANSGSATITSASLNSVSASASSPLRSKLTKTSYDGSAAAAHDGSATMDAEFDRSVKISAKIAKPENEKGITVGGAKSDQEFHHGAWFATDGVKHVMIIKILGETDNGKVITKPVTVKTKVECPTCGTKNKHGTKFCRECGTGLSQV